MVNLNELFVITVAKDHMSAELNCTEQFETMISELSLSENQIIEFLKERKIVYGIQEENVKKIVNELSISLFPLTIAIGKKPVDGDDGYLEYHVELSTEVEHDLTQGLNFREVVRIPTVHEGDKLLTKIERTNGIDGKNVYGRTVRARPGRPMLMNPGKNVEFNESDQTFYATTVGQIQVLERFVHVHTVYELHESVSMKTGNINFAGSVIIRGDVPTGFTVKASGDITIYGLVEAATIEAGGSVTVSEGLAGLRTGSIEAGENVNIGYINQGNVHVGDSLFVENSILHSEIVAKNDVFCQRGNIIGGSISAGKSIEAKDIGNRMNTETKLSFGVNISEDQNIQQLVDKKDQLTDNLQKLNVLKERLSKNSDELDSKGRVTLLRLERSRTQTVGQIEEIDKKLEESNASLGDINLAYLNTRGTLYSNVLVAFGRYKRRVEKDYDFVQVKIIENEIKINPL